MQSGDARGGSPLTGVWGCAPVLPLFPAAVGGIQKKCVKALHLIIKENSMPTLYLTEDYALVRRDSEDCLLVQIPGRRAKDGATPSPARKERIPLIKIDELVVLGEVTLT